MLAVACFDLLPGAFRFAGLPLVVTGVLFGSFGMSVIESIAKRSFGGAGLKRTGACIAFGVALHNLPEGLAIGSGMEANLSIGLSLALAILLHNIPEGFSIALPLMSGGYGRLRSATVASLAGVPMGAGALLGAAAGLSSPIMVSLCMSVACGAMLNIILYEMLPEAQAFNTKKLRSPCCVIGFLIGLAVAYIF